MSDDDTPAPEKRSERETLPSAGKDTREAFGRLMGSGGEDRQGESAGAVEVPYQVGRLLGQGGMGRVFSAEDSSLDRTVAVKVLRPELADDEGARERFLREAKVLGRLEHPGAVPVHAAGWLPDHGPFYAMKLLSGETLGKMIERAAQRGRPHRDDIARLVHVFDSVCQTIAYAHAHGIVHRDLKPENVMVDDFGVVLVLDWGLAKDMREAGTATDPKLTRDGAVIGTPAYMAPEQARGDTAAVDLRTDVFALGSILYEILTGLLPFTASTPMELIREVQHAEPHAPCAANRRAPRALSAICMKALSKDPDRRYPSAKELAEDVRRYLDDLPVTAYRASALERAGNWVARHPAASAAAATAVILLMVLAGLVTVRREARKVRLQEQEDRDRLVAELEAARSREEVQSLLNQLQAASRAAQRVQGEIARARQAGGADTAEARQNLMELAVAREVHLRMMVGLAVLFRARLAAAPAGALSPDDDPMALMRSAVLQYVGDLTSDGRPMEAHVVAWRQLRGGGVPGWTDAEVAALQALLTDAEEAMRERLGEAFEPPDWSRYDFHEMPAGE